MVDFRQRLIEPLRTETARKGLIALVDQALYSGTNFVVGVMLARYLPKEQFGMFVFLYSIPTFALGFLSSVISGPMLVLGANCRADRREYFSSLLHLQIIASAAITLVSLGMYFVGRLFTADLPQRVVIVVATAFLMMSGQEFVRRVFLTNVKTRELLVNDVVLSSVQITFLFLLLIFGNSSGVEASAVTALGCIAASFGVAAFVGLWQHRNLLRGSPRTHLWKSHLKENWQFGKWLLGTHVGSTAFSQLAVWIVAAWGGSIATANFEATRLVVAPAQILLFAAGNYLTPVAAKRYATGGSRVLQLFMKKLLPFWMAAFVAYLVLAVSVSSSVLVFLFGDKYASAQGTVLLWILVFFVLGLKQLPGTVLIAMRRPDVCMTITLVAGIVTVGLTVWFTLAGGETLAVAARLIGESILFLAFLYYSIRVIRQRAYHSES